MQSKKSKSIIKFGAWGAVLTTAISCSPSQQIKTERENLPNIILIHLDDMGYGDLSLTGATGYKTPHIDKMAREGLFFTHYYSAQAV